MRINDIDIEVEHKKIKHIHLSVYPPDGRVHASVPQETTEEQLRLFVLGKWIWLMEKRQEATSHNIQPKREYVSGEAHYYKGTLYRLRVDVFSSEIQGVFIEGDYIVVRCRRQENAETLIKEWYRDTLKEVLPALVDRWVKRIVAPVPTIDVLAMPLRWGSCNSKTLKIMFNLELAKKPLECIEYIVAHEVIHLIEHNHTPRFFRLLDTYMPSWKVLKDQLDELPY